MSTVSGTVLVSVINNDSVKDVYYIRARDAVNSKLNYKYLRVTIKGNKEDVIAALAAKARNSDGLCPYCGKLLCWTQQTGRPGDSASLDRIWNTREIDESNLEWVSDDCNWSKSAKTPEAFIRHSFAIVFHITKSAISKDMTIDQYIRTRWPKTV